MRETLIAYLTGCGTRLHALAAIRSSAREGGAPWFLLWELLPLLPVLGFLLAILLASDPASRLSRVYGWLYLAVAAVAASAVVYAQRQRHRLSKTTTATIKNTAHGNVELRGEARPLPGAMALRTPLTGEVGLWYQAVRNKRRGLSEPWYVDHSEASNVPFMIYDGSGQCIVLPSGLASTGAHEWRSRSGLEERVERWIAPGDIVFAAGEIRTLSRDDLPAKLVASLPDTDAFRVLVAPRDGRPFLIGNKSDQGEQLFYRAANSINMAFLLLALAVGTAILRFGQGG